MKTSEPIIMPDSPEAASYRTDIKGWVSRDGFFYGDKPDSEHIARYAGSTRSYCQRCNGIASKSWTLCDPCCSVKDHERFLAMPRADWDGKAMIYSQTRDQYFNDPADALDYLEEGQNADALQLVICTPNYVRPLDHEYCSDELAEDVDEPPNAVLQAMDAFNKAVHGIVLSWSPGKFALNLAAHITTAEVVDGG
jgi:hypothetical protein